MTPLLLTGATVVTVDRDRRVLHDGAVLVDGDRIADVGATSELVDRHRSVEVIDCSARVIIPETRTPTSSRPCSRGWATTWCSRTGSPA